MKFIPSTMRDMLVEIEITNTTGSQGFGTDAVIAPLPCVLPLSYPDICLIVDGVGKAVPFPPSKTRMGQHEGDALKCLLRVSRISDVA